MTMTDIMVKEQERASVFPIPDNPRVKITLYNILSSPDGRGLVSVLTHGGGGPAPHEAPVEEEGERLLKRDLQAGTGGAHQVLTVLHTQRGHQLSERCRAEVYIIQCHLHNFYRRS